MREGTLGYRKGSWLPAALGSDHSCPPQRNSSLPDENNVARLQEELKALKVREGQAVASARELKLQLQELSDTWQVKTYPVERKQPCNQEVGHPPCLGDLGAPGLTTGLSWQAHLSRGGRWKESPRKLVLGELQDELMSVRLREAQALAEGRELRQRVVELETQVGCSHPLRDLVPTFGSPVRP